MKTILSINKEFFTNVSESIAKYNVNKLNNAPKISNSKESFDLFLNEYNGKILAKGGICSTTVDSSTNEG